MPETSNGIVPYQNARRSGRKWLGDHARDPYGGGLPVLEQELRGVETMGEISLGTHDIPLKKIVGTYTAARADAFAGNFMPLYDEGTEFAAKWRSLYGHHLRDGITDPIKVYEYLGRFYVIEGNKRVSVMNYVGAYSIYADITRIVPKYDENDEEIRIYYEIMDYDPRSFAFGDMWFSQVGTFSWLISEAEDFASKTPELEGKRPHEWVPTLYRDFAMLYGRAGFRDIELTTADAFSQYVAVYGFPYGMKLADLEERVKSCEGQFRMISEQLAPVTIEAGESSPASGRGILGVGTRRAHVVFVYRSEPEISSWTRSHETGRRELEQYFEGRVTAKSIYGVGEEDAYLRLDEIISEEKPDILFTVSSAYAKASLQVALENPKVLVFNCNHANPEMKLNTYYCKLFEQAFVLGALAGAYTKSDVIGFVDLPQRATESTYSINAFTQGARLVNRNIVVKRCKPRVNYSGDEDRLCRRMLAERGADVILSQYPTYGSVPLKPCDDLYAMLSSVYPNGRIKEYLAAPAIDWGVMYKRIVGDYLDGAFNRLGTDTPSLYFWLGLTCGLAKIYTVDAALGSHTVRLGEMLGRLISERHLHPLLGPMSDREGNLRIESYKAPSLMEIQSMDWLCDVVDEELFVGQDE